MKTIHQKFKTKDQFLKELHNADIPLNHDHILIQILSGTQDKKIIQPILDFLKETLPNSFITGVTTDGIVFNDQFIEDSLLISVLCFENTRLRIEKTENPSEDFFLEGVRLGEKLQGDGLKAAILFAEGMSVNGEDLLTGFENKVGDIVIAGGLAADNSNFQQTNVFYQNEILYKGAVAVGLYSDTLRVKATSAFDCDIMDEEFIVTESKGNLVKRINNLTPEALYRDYLGLHFDKQLIEVCAQVPMVVNREGEVLARSATNLYPNGVLRFTGNLKKGEKVHFAIASVEKILRNAINIYNNIKDNWDVIFMTSCTGRKFILGDKLAHDIQPFPNIAPVSGFFSYGEFIKKKGKRALFCNQTMVLLFLSESENIPISKPVLSYEEDVLSTDPLLPREEENVREKNKSSGNPDSITQDPFILVEHKNKIKKQLILSENRNKIMKQWLFKDPLTGLKSRALLLQKLKDKTPRGILLIDIKDFHAINDLYGESVGNLILQAFATFLRKQFESPEIYRLSGNTFAVLNIFNQTPTQCMATARSLIRDIESENFYFKKGETTLECAISITIGISNEKNGKSHLEHADMALNYAKRHHKSIVLYSENLGIKQKYEQDIAIIKMVKKALDENRIVPFFQPVFEGKRIAYYEALIRLIAEDGSILTPFHFLDVIKNTTYYAYLTRTMIKKSFEVFTQLDNMVSINLSFLDFSNTGTMNYLFKMIKSYNMGKKLILEILESEVFQDYETTIEQIVRFRALGAKIAIDDFGSGYSNFLHVTQIDPNYIKIDGTLIKNIDTDAKSLAICKAIIGFAKDMDMETVAELIHSKEILDITTRLKVDKHQGFYLGEPQKAEDLFKNLFAS